MKNKHQLEWNLTFHYLTSGHFSSLINIISVIGVFLGTAALIITLSVMNGFNFDLQQKITGNTAQVTVMKAGDTEINDYLQLEEKILKVEGVEAVSPFITTQVMIRRGERAYGCVLKAIDPFKTKQVLPISQYIKEGSFEELKDNKIILGKELALNLGVTTGDEVVIIYPLEILPRIKKFQISGIFEVGMYEYDAGLAYIHLKSAQDFFDLEGVSGLEVKTSNIFLADQISTKIQEEIKYPYLARSWISLNRNLFSALELEKKTMFLLVFLIVIVSAFNITSGLIVMTRQKRREIGILRTIGLERKSILKIFLKQGFIIGVTGSFAGAGIGYLVCFLLNKYKFIRLEEAVYYLSYLPVKMQGLDFLIVIFGAIIVSLLATIYPAYKAFSIDPIEAIKYE